MARKPSSYEPTANSHSARGRKRTRTGRGGTTTPADSYQVGPGRPPKEHQFRKGESGNPSGRRRKKSVAADLARALDEKVTVRQGSSERVVTKRQAGIEQLVNQFATGDRYARRDLLDLVAELGIDLVGSQGGAIEQAIEANVSATDLELLADFVRRCGGKFDPSDPQEKPATGEDPEQGGQNRKEKKT